MEGEFWRFDTPDRRESGVVRSRRGQSPLVDIERPIVDLTADTVTVSQFGGVTIRHGGPEEVVSALQPITMCGELAGGRQVTLLEARGRTHPARGAPRQQYEAQYLIDGATVTGQQPYRSVRFKLSQPFSWSHIEAGASVELADGSTIALVEEDSGRWLTYRMQDALTLRPLAGQIVAGVQVLAALAFKELDEDDVSVTDTQIQIEDGEPWLKVHSGNLYANHPNTFSSLLRTSVLTLDMLARWIPVHATLDDLDWAVAEPPTGAIQTSLLARASVAEGLHRRLFPMTRRFDLDKRTLKKIRDELRDRGTELFKLHGVDDREQTDKCISDALGFMNEVSFRDRVDEMAEVVNRVAPQVLEGFDDFPRQLVRARNDLAHFGEPQKKAEKYEQKIDRWTVFNLAIPWMLRVLLLEIAGVQPDALREALDDSMAFAFYRANVQSIINELAGLDEG